MAIDTGVQEREEALLDDWESLNAESGALEARRITVLADRFDLLLEADPAGSRYHDMAFRSLAAEYAAVAHLSPTVAEGALFRAHTVAHEFSATLRALADGAITSRHVDALLAGARSLGDASVEQKAEYERRVLESAVGESAGRTMAIAKLIAADIAPLSVAEKHRRARELRESRLFSLDDGLGQLLLTAPEHLLRAAFDRATEMAKQVIAARPDKVAEDEEPDTRTLDQIRADIMLELLLAARADTLVGTPAEAVTATVQVTISASTLAGEDERMAELDGYGPLLAEDARELAAQSSSWVQVFVTAGGMVCRTNAYSPTADMKRFLRARDQRCRFPGCRRAARRSQIDHNIDHAKGGPTDLRNLACFCVGHHTLKHPDLLDRHRWSVRQLPGGVIAWISPSGHTYIDEPPRRVMFA